MLKLQNRSTDQFDSNGDSVNLVESQANERENKQMKPINWKTFGSIIDRVLFVVLVFIYLFMVIDFLPEKFFGQHDAKPVEIIRY